ncbi:hypothetical protein AERO8C_120177 [Aeromonas veronii]|uniref:Uncharacterized protein n=1 Tax=Aeromonas veronii TaxID=654 RepID=A0A653KR63_AERVE|nr:hypothetical protein AERO8C_120177 [Aeromonas veronii]
MLGLLGRGGGLPDLRQHPGKLHPLPLAAGESRIEPLGQMLDPGMGHGRCHNLVAPRRRFTVWQAPHGDHFLAEKGEVEGGALRQYPESVGQLAAVPLLAIRAKQGDGTLIFQLAGQALEQRALARPVGAEQRGEGAALEVEIEPIQDLALATAQAEAGAAQQGGGE